MEFKQVPNTYRPIPFWSWNGKLESEETRRQVRLMSDAGIGGFFMHARGGLQTEYLSDEWFRNIAAAKDEGKARGMRPWAYDENGWPSGFGGGLVCGKGAAFQQKYLRMEKTPTHPETQIFAGENCAFYYEVNPFYIDVLDAAVVARKLNDRGILLPESGCYDSIRNRLSDYIKLTRINQSKSLLAETTMAVRDISNTCGFSGVTYFRSLFKTYVGIAPGQYRKMHRKTAQKEVSKG